MMKIHSLILFKLIEDTNELMPSSQPQQQRQQHVDTTESIGLCTPIGELLQFSRIKKNI